MLMSLMLNFIKTFLFGLIALPLVVVFIVIAYLVGDVYSSVHAYYTIGLGALILVIMMVDAFKSSFYCKLPFVALIGLGATIAAIYLQYVQGEYSISDAAQFVFWASFFFCAVSGIYWYKGSWFNSLNDLFLSD